MGGAKRDGSLCVGLMIARCGSGVGAAGLPECWFLMLGVGMALLAEWSFFLRHSGGRGSLDGFFRASPPHYKYSTPNIPHSIAIDACMQSSINKKIISMNFHNLVFVPHDPSG